MLDLDLNCNVEQIEYITSENKMNRSVLSLNKS